MQFRAVRARMQTELVVGDASDSAMSAPEPIAAPDDLTAARARGDAAVLALAESEARLRQVSGAAVQERNRLREQIAALSGTPANKARASPEALRGPAPKRARLERRPSSIAAPAPPSEGEPMLTLSQAYSRYHLTEAALRAERTKSERLDEELARQQSEMDALLPLHREMTSRLDAAVEANNGLSERLVVAMGRTDALEKEAAELRLEVSALTATAKEALPTGAEAGEVWELV